VNPYELTAFRMRSAAKIASTLVKNLKYISSSNLNKRTTESVTIRKKTAKIIANTVMAFWAKVERVNTLRCQVAEAKAAKLQLDMQLDNLVKVTEAYLIKLAKKLDLSRQLDDSERSDYGQINSCATKVMTHQANLVKSSRANQKSGFADTSIDLTLLKHRLRSYQLAGVKWMRSCYINNLNVLLADEMGLGKTIQTIGLISLLATEFGNWGPHLIVVPTSVMLNWEVEFKKWCPALKVFTYYGSIRERRTKRHGWSIINSFHVCITSYKIVTQDHGIFRRKNWEYLILDEAHMIKNWRSQRWQKLLKFSTKHRLLITGTPLQNELMELWALLHFLMPDLFTSHSEFKDWFASPLTAMVDGSQSLNDSLVSRLHAILRPFVLRRLKSEVEKSLPCKYEHLVKCQLSKRQRRLYEEYISSNSTIQTLSNGNAMGVMNCLMQLRKVCNHIEVANLSA
jgi:helicase SWR1